MKYMHTLASCLSLFIFTGCFEILEEIRLNDDGSGEVTMTVNASKSKTKLNSIMLMDSINNYKVPSKKDIGESLEKMVAEISGIKGVSNVSKKTDYDEFIFSISCEFTDVDVLNRVIKHFSTQEHASRAGKQFSYDRKNKTFVRNYDYNLSKEINRVRHKDREILDGATVTTIYRFESPIATAKNAESRIAGNKKAIMLKVDVPDLISDKKNIKNTISLQ